jgi:hypothetical protein
MWMKSRFAQWEVEGDVRERVNHALRQAEYARLAQKANGAEAELARGGWRRSVKRGWRWLAVGVEAVLSAVWSSLADRSEPKQESS